MKSVGARYALAGICGFLAAVHLVRLVCGWDVTIEGWSVPRWVSGLIVVVAGTLAGVFKTLACGGACGLAPPSIAEQDHWLNSSEGS